MPFTKEQAKSIANIAGKAYADKLKEVQEQLIEKQKKEVQEQAMNKSVYMDNQYKDNNVDRFARFCKYLYMGKGMQGEAIRYAEMSKDNETKTTLKSLSDSVGKIAGNQIISELEAMISELKRKENEEIKKSENDIKEILDFLSEPINIENKIGNDSTKIIDNINNIGSNILK